MDRGKFGPYCKMTDKIKCKDCGNLYLISNLVAVTSHYIPLSDKGSSWQVIYYYCPCDPVGVKVYDDGTQKLQFIEGSYSELILS